MVGAEIPHAIELLVGLLALAAVVAIIARPLRLPDTVALVIAGLVIGIGASVTGYPPIEVAPAAGPDRAAARAWCSRPRIGCISSSCAGGSADWRCWPFRA